MIQDAARGFLRNFLAVYTGTNLLWHALAIGLTAALVLTGIDWRFFEATRSDAFYWLVMGAGIGGFFAPVAIPVGAYLWGEFSKNRWLMQIGAASAQAAAIGYLVSIIYKAFTGRTEPEFLTHYSMVDITRDFNFGFWENGIFWGWPSSHTAVAFAGAFVFVFLSRRLTVRVAAVAYALFIASGAAIGFHWLSDVLAGVILGILVAAVVAKSIENKK